MDLGRSTQGWFTPGQEVHGLRVERFLGQGAFSTVFLARDVLIDRVVALKVLHPVAEDVGRTTAPEEVLNEARLVGRLASPHVVTLYRVHPPDEQGLWMFEMEYLEGGTLEAQLEGGLRLRWSQAKPLLESVVAGLDHAHQRDVVHGDVKAGNVLLTLDGSARLADFGLARLAGDAPLTERGSGSPRGTPLYMAPEVLMGRPGGPAADLWSLGVLLYRTLAGQFPFDTQDFRVLFHAVQAAAPKPLGPDVPAPVADVVSACLAKRPEDRPPNAAAVLARLRGPARATIAQTPTTDATRTPLIGREEETRQVREALDEGKGVLLSGAAGAGRSALLAHLAAQGRSAGETWLEVSLPVSGGLLVPLVDALREALGEDAAELATEARFGAGATLLGEVLARGAEHHLGQGPWIVRELLRLVADAGPAVLALDDVENLDEEDGALLANLGRIPTGLLLSRLAERPNEAVAPALQALTGDEPLRRVHLEGLLPASMFGLLEAAAAPERVDPKVAERVIARAGGSPRFALDLLEHLRATAAVRVEGHVLVPGPSWEQADLPQRIQDLTAQRLARLDTGDRELLDVAAVDGMSFDGNAVAAVTGRPLLEVLRRFQGLVREYGLVVPEEHGFRFAQPLLREAVVDQVAPEMRRALHLALAEHLESRRERDDVDPERIGHHWSSGGDEARARPHLLSAMGRAARREELRRAIHLARRAGLEDGPLDPATIDEQLEDLLALARAYQQAGVTEKVTSLYERLHAHVQDDAEDARRARVLAHDAWTRYATRGLEDAEVELLRHLAADAAAGPARAQALSALGRHAIEGSDLEKAEAYLSDAARAWAALDEEGELATQHLLLGIAARRTGRLSDAERRFVEASEANRRAGNRLNALIGDVNRYLCRYEQGKTHDLEQGLVRAIHQLELIDAKAQALHTRCILASVRHAVGDAAGAMAAQEEVLGHALPLNYLPALVMAYPNLARWRLASGDFEQAATLRKAWGDIREKADSGEALCEQAIFDARYRSFVGDREGARPLVREALARVLALKSERVRVKQIAALAEGVYDGIAAEDVRELEPALASVDLPDDPVLDFTRAMLGSAFALATPDGNPARLGAAALALRSAKTGEGRASRESLAGWLAAEAALRAGDAKTAADEAGRALSAAVALQNVWLQLHLLAVLHRLHPEDVYGERRDALIQHLAKRLPRDEDAERFRRAWCAPT